MRHTTGNLIYSLAAEGPLRVPARSILKSRGKSLCNLGVISEASEAAFPIARRSIFSRAAPRFHNAEPRIEIDEFSDVNAHLIHDASVCAYSGHVLKNGLMLVPPARYSQRHRIASNGGSLGFYTKGYAVCNAGPTKLVDEAIHIGGDGAFNWYHFAIECMAKAFMTRSLPIEFQNFPLIVPDEVSQIDSFRDLLSAILPGRDWITFGQDTFHVRRLVVFDEVSIGPYNMHKGFWPILSDYAHHECIMGAFFNEIRHLFLSSYAPRKGRRRLFIIRPGRRRNYNQSELLNIARRYGFEPFLPEKLSLGEQAHAFCDASHVVGASGAAWTGMIFSGRPFRGISWLLPEYREFSSYSMLAHFLGHDLNFLTATADRPIHTTGDAYSVAQTVSIADFESALRHLCNDD